MSLNAQESIEYLNTLLQLPDAAGAKAAILAIASAAGLPTTSWIAGDPGERTAEYMGRAMNAWGAIPIAATRALFFALSTDPGDVDDFGNPDPSADQTPRPGFLSALGVGWYGTERGGETNATSFVVVKNNTLVSIGPFGPGQLTFEYSTASRDDGGFPTYITTADPSIYTGLGGTLTLAPGATSVPLPVQCVQLGSYGNAPTDAVDTCVTTSFGVLTVLSSTAAIGRDREARTDYIERCLLAPDGNAPGGPTNAYLRAMNTGSDGRVLRRYDDSGDVGIDRAQVVAIDGAITCYFADADGPADAIDVDSANANIEGVVLGVITDPLGVVPDCVTYTGLPAIPTTIPVTYTVRAKASSIPGASAGTYTTGGSPPAWAAAVFDEIGISIDLLLGGYPIGGVEQVSGAGVLYTTEIVDAIHDARTGLYAAAVTTPGASTVALPVGNVPVRGTTNGTLTIVAG